jgi:hypothetical protein
MVTSADVIEFRFHAASTRIQFKNPEQLRKFFAFTFLIIFTGCEKIFHLQSDSH